MATVIVRSDDGWGSGAFISADGWMLTNYHVVERAAQRASISGAVATLDVIAPEVAGDRLKAGQARRARLYRADPVHDLALLKLESPPAPVAFFKLADKVDEGQDCVVIGSQGNGPAWWVRASIVSQVFDFPADLSQVAAGVVSLLYREYVDDLVRPAFQQDLTYTLTPGEPTEISFRTTRLVVEHADNAGIRYRVLAGLKPD